MKRVGRYIIVEELNLEQRHLFSRKERVEDEYKKINEYNSIKNNPYFIGDLTFNYNTRTLYYRKYKKVTQATQLDLLDEMTTKFESEDSLKRKFQVESNNKLFIAYRANRKIKVLDIFYKRDVKYLNEYYLESKFLEYSKDEKFLRRILSNKFISTFKFSLEQYETLFYHVNNGYLVNSRPVLDFYQAFIYPNGVKSYINLRFLSNIMREYEISINVVKEDEILFYPEEIEGQMMIEGYDVGILKHFFEDVKIGESTEEEVVKKLIRKGY